MSERLLPVIGIRSTNEKEQEIAPKCKDYPNKVGEVKSVVAFMTKGDDMRRHATHKVK